jgi:hypothetical protein
MKPVRTETTNAVYTLEGCNDLPVTRYENVDNKEMGVESCWELDAEDLENIKNNGGMVYLYIQGAVVPPVLLTTESMVFFKEGDGQNE